MGNRTIKTHPVRGTVSLETLRAAVLAVRARAKPGRPIVSKSSPITSQQTASGRKLIAFKVPKGG